MFTCSRIAKKSYISQCLLKQTVKHASNYFGIVQLNEEQESMKEMAYEFAKQEIEPYAEQIDVEDEFDRSIWTKMGELGLLGITAPEKYGGCDLGYFEHCIVSEEISRASASVGLSYIAHSNL